MRTPTRRPGRRGPVRALRDRRRSPAAQHAPRPCRPWPRPAPAVDFADRLRRGRSSGPAGRV